MAIINPNDQVFKSLIGTECNYCGLPVYPPGVMWAGFGDCDLVLHAPCCVELCLRLGRDVLEIEHTTGQYVARTALFDLRTPEAEQEAGS